MSTTLTVINIILEILPMQLEEKKNQQYKHWKGGEVTTIYTPWDYVHGNTR